MRLSYAGRSFLFRSAHQNGLKLRPHSLVHLVCVDLGGVSDVGVVQEILNTEHNLGSVDATPVTITHLLDRDGRLPRLLLVQNAETDGSGGVDVGVEQRRGKATWGALVQVHSGSLLSGTSTLTLRGLGRVVCC